MIIKIPLTSILLYAICNNLTYLWDGALSLPNDTDIGLILQRNPNLNPSFILYFSLLWFILVIIFSLSSMTKKLVNKTKVVLNIIYPDVSPFSCKIWEIQPEVRSQNLFSISFSWITYVLITIWHLAFEKIKIEKIEFYNRYLDFFTKTTQKMSSMLINGINWYPGIEGVGVIG